MKGKLFFCFAALMACVLHPLGAFAAVPAVSAESAVLVCRNNCAVLFSKDENERRAIASTTKIMTALLTLEAAADDDRAVTITQEMIRVEGSSMGLRAGEILPLSSLAAGMLTVSGNDAANAAAIAIAGSTEQFSVLMNEKARQLGMQNTHFVTPSGLDDDEHYSSARDMAILTCAALQNEDFASIVSQKTCAVRFLNPDETLTFGNHNRLLSLFDSCTGVKTGFTKKAGRCLVSAAERNGVQLVAVTLDDPDDWTDHVKLLEYGFSQLKSQTPDDSSFRVQESVVGGTENSVEVCGTVGTPVVTEDSAVLTRIVELPRFLYAPVAAGQSVGSIRYEYEGKTVARTELVAASDVVRAVLPKSWLQVFWNGLKSLLAG